MIELLSPAGNLEKLTYAYMYGADAAYIGLKKFSLRIKADNFYEEEYKSIINLKKQYPSKKLFCALNISFHNDDIKNFLNDIEYFRQYPIDAFIVQDIGIIPILQKEFPNVSLHLSTQANCINYSAVKMYESLGFSRIVLGREASLKDVRIIKDAVPNMELEVFAHGAMCIAYSGRCLMSAYMTGRSANAGFCSHSCRWNFQLLADPTKTVSPQDLAQSGSLVLQEKERPGEYFPVFEGDGFTEILSSKDLCMVDHLAEMRDAGVDSLKIEGRMKSLYYTSLVTRAYRKALDSLYGIITPSQAEPFVSELYKANHREFSTGFFYDRQEADKTTTGESKSEFEMVGTIGEKLTDKQESELFQKGKAAKQKYDDELATMHESARLAELRAIELHPERELLFQDKKDGYNAFEFIASNMVRPGDEIEFVGPDVLFIADKDFYLIDPDTGLLMNWVCNSHRCVIYTSKNISKSWIARIKCVKIRKGR